MEPSVRHRKSKLQQKLTMTVIPEPDVYTSIIDMGLIWHLTTPTIEDREKGDGTKYTWGDYAEQLVHFVLMRHKHLSASFVSMIHMIRITRSRTVREYCAKICQSAMSS